MAYIYALKDPETRRIRYIGKADCVKRRLAVHLSDKCRCHRTNWIGSLKERGLIPELEILVIVPDSEWPEWEKKFIATARELGMDLTNQTVGGEAPMEGKKQSAETIAKRVAKMVGRPSKLRGRKASPETCAKISAALTGVPKSPEHIKRVLEANRGRVLSEEARKNISAAKLGKTQTAETREKKRIASLLFWEKKRNAVSNSV